MFCTYCGAPLHENEEFCIKCGERRFLTQENPSAEETPCVPEDIIGVPIDAEQPAAEETPYVPEDITDIQSDAEQLQAEEYPYAQENAVGVPSDAEQPQAEETPYVPEDIADIPSDAEQLQAEEYPYVQEAAVGVPNDMEQSPMEGYPYIQETAPAPKSGDSFAEPIPLAGESVQKPLYGYEPYSFEQHGRQDDYTPPLPEKPLYAKEPAVVRQGSPYASAPPFAMQFPPMPVPAQPYAYAHQTPNQPRGDNRKGFKTTPIVLAIILASIFIMIGIIAAAGILADSIKEGISELLGGQVYSGKAPDYNDRFPENALPPDFGGDFGQPSNDYSEYEILIGDYFTMAEKGDPSGLAGFLHEKVVATLEAEGFMTNEFAAELDVYIDNYGMTAERFSIYGVFPYVNSDYALLSEKFGFDQAKLQQYVNVEVEVTLSLDGTSEIYYYDFDLIKTSGIWYIVGIW